MKWLFRAISLVVFGLSASAATPSLEELWEVVQEQAEQIEALKTELNEAREKVAITEERLEVTTNYVESIDLGESRGSKTAIGGYGELHYNNLDAADSNRDLKKIDYHRFVLFFDHEFSDSVRLFSEFELEHSLAGDGKSGEVELEQAFLEIDLNEEYYTRTGLFLVPVGILNETHEPPTFFGVERNDVENVILPSTWWEAGIDVGGRYESGFSWDFAVHSGLKIPTEGSKAFRVRSGRQKVAEASANNLAYTIRGRYTGVPGLDISATYQVQQDPSQGSNDGLDGGKLINLNAIYQIGEFQVRALWAQWHFNGTAVEAADADEQAGWYIEPSYRFNAFERSFGVYYRYEDVEGARVQDRFDQWQIGFNWYPVSDTVLKVDWRNRSHDLSDYSGGNFKGFDLSVGYQF
jgi:hypothetical protein